ncbi:MAG TPA: DUF2330 domain-containing protein [Planctomycetota bacterium]|nr:DUF2330 domain-containing protein [Planctomycetota bacterium]
MDRRVGVRVAGLVVGLVVVCLVSGPAGHADRGSIVLRKVKVTQAVTVSEPAQRAIIAHNGEREVLILQTDVQASAETKVLEFMPLPAKPTVSLASKACFSRLQDILRAHRIRYIYTDWVEESVGPGDAAEAERRRKEETVTVVVEQHLGPHEVTVVEVKDADDFVKWVEDFCREKDLGEPVFAKDLRTIVTDYLKRDFRFFAFDVLTLSSRTRTVAPLVYEFQSFRLYYPLKVTNLYGGRGTIELFLILPRGIYPRESSVADTEGTALLRASMWSTDGILDGGELRGLHTSMQKLMEEEEPVLRATQYNGELTFTEDLWAPMGFASAEKLCRRFLDALTAGDAQTLAGITSLPFAFDRREVITDREQLSMKLSDLLERTRRKRLDIDPGSLRRTRAGVLRTQLNDFDRTFMKEHLKRTGGFVLTFRIGGEDVVMFLRRSSHGGCTVAGFGD